METAAGATQRKIHYALSGTGALVPSASGGAGTQTGTNYVDTFKDLSLVNHRLYRQGRVPMARIGFVGPFSTDVTFCAVAAFTLPNTWQVRKAHQLALKEYLRATKEERRRTGQARWHDFKVWYEDGMRTGTTLSPVGITTGSSEWPYSQITEEDGTTERRYKFIGSTDSAAFGMIAEYDSMDDTDQDQPNNPGSGASGPYSDLHPDVSDKNKDNLLDEGDNPPYNPDNLQVQEQVTSIAVGSGKSDKLVSEWFPVPCGLIRLQSMLIHSAGIADDTAGAFFVEVMGGDYKGIHATTMGLKL